MLVAGELLGQPADLWYAQQQAGYFFDVLGRRSKVTNWLTDTTMSADDIATLEELDALSAT